MISNSNLLALTEPINLIVFNIPIIKVLTVSVLNLLVLILISDSSPTIMIIPHAYSMLTVMPLFDDLNLKLHMVIVVII